MYVCMMHISMVLDLDPEACTYVCMILDPGACMHVRCIYMFLILILDYDACVYDAHIYDPGPRS